MLDALRMIGKTVAVTGGGTLVTKAGSVPFLVEPEDRAENEQ